MEFLSLENVSKSYGEKVLFDHLNLTISKGEKIALIAKNGSGKSTLLKLIVGLTYPEGEHSRVLLNKKIVTEYLSQNPKLDLSKTVGECFFDLDLPEFKAIRQFNTVQGTSDNASVQDAIAQMDELKAWNVEAAGKEILSRLHLNDLNLKVSYLSGGQKKRLALAKVVMRDPDFLVLDEPTNHLDIEMIEWLEKYLLSSKLTLLMVTHDRYFLERVCNQIIELDKGRLFAYKGNYSQYLEKKAIRTHQNKMAVGKAKKLFFKELEWIRRQPQARTTKAKSRIHDFNKLKDEISSISYEDVFAIAVDSARLGKKILEFYDVDKSFGEISIVKSFWYKFKKADRIGICGPNGSGKSTFANLLIGAVSPDSGRRVVGETVKFGYYTQDGLDISVDKRVIDVIRDIAEYIPLKKKQKMSAAALLEKFMFSRSQQQVYISQLSGGERKRLHLLTVLAENPNFLILDEPTNDLDVLTLNVLEEYLLKFEGCLVIISHDRYFMDKLVNHMFIFSGDGRIEDYNGTYSEWKSSRQPSVEKKILTDQTQEGAQGRQLQKRKLSYLEKKEMSDIEEAIRNHENRRKEIEVLFIEHSLDPDEIKSLSKELSDVKSQIDQLENRWLILSELL